MRAEDIAASLPAGGGRLPGRPHRAARSARRDGATALVVAGGVAANQRDPRGACRRSPPRTACRFVAPPLWLCTDNAAMIAWAGAQRFDAGLTDALDAPARAALAARSGRGKGARRGGEGMKIGVIGGGAWGTALAQVAAARRRDVLLWAREPEVVEAINARAREPAVPRRRAARRRRSARPAISPISATCDALLVVAPAQHMRARARAACRSARTPLILCAKGIEAGTRLLMHEVARAGAAATRRSRCCPARPSRTRSPPACRPR